MVVSISHPSNAEKPTDVRIPLVVTLCRLVQPLKVLEGISVIEAGSSTLAKAVQPANRLPSATTSPSGREMLVKAVALLKAPGCVMRLRVEGRFTSDRELQ